MINLTDQTVWITEKPNQARALATALGVVQSTKEYIRTQKGIVVWGFGHLLELANPEDYCKEWRSWKFETIPMVPEKWQLLPKPKVKAHLSAIKKLVSKASSIVVATDADAEGEAIGRNIIEYCKATKIPSYRLWSSSMATEGLLDAISKIKPLSATDGYYLSALARSRADWLLGINATRFLTLASRIGKSFDKDAPTYRAGRVKTPTLSLIRARDQEIQSFVSKKYFEVEAKAEQDGKLFTLYCRPSSKDQIWTDPKIAENISSSIKNKTGDLSVTHKDANVKSPELFSLSGLQKHTNKSWGWSPNETLEVLQELYETHQVVSYPRTDSTYLPPSEVHHVLPTAKKLAGLDARYEACLPNLTTDKSIVRDSDSSHYGLIPTGKISDKLNEREKRLFELVCTRFYSAFLPDGMDAKTTLNCVIDSHELKASGKVEKSKGWRIFGNPEKEGKEKEPTLPAVNPGLVKIVDTKIIEKNTSPPSPYTEGTLLEDMLNIKKYYDDKGIVTSLARADGIGTEATRGPLISDLHKTKLIEYVGKTKNITCTKDGLALLDLADKYIPVLTDAAQTAEWEGIFEDMRKGKSSITDPDYLANKMSHLLKNLPTIEKPEVQTHELVMSNEMHTTKNGLIPKKVGNIDITEEMAQHLAEGRELGPFLSQNPQTKEDQAICISFWKEKNKVTSKVLTPSGKLYKGEPVYVAPSGTRLFSTAFPDGIISSNIMGKKLEAAEIIEIMEAEGGKLVKGLKKKTGESYDATIIYDADEVNTYCSSCRGSFKFAPRA